SWEYVAPPGQDARVMMAEIQNDMVELLDAVTSKSLVNAAKRLVDELPEGVSVSEAMTHMMVSAIRDDAAQGVIWPNVDPAHIAATGHDWQLFPNTVILHGLTFALCYRARPNGTDPNSCIFEAYVIEQFPEGQAPKTEWVQVQDMTDPAWPKVFQQDFANMP